jgi:peroxiredoxin/energy-converting hydrogenase Eha subunit A
MNQRSLRRVLLLCTAAVVIVGVTVAVIVSIPQRASPPVQVSAAPEQAPAAPTPGAATGTLETAADALGFRQTTAADVGVVESLPPDTPLLAPSKSLLPVGAAAPDFTLSTATGQSVRLSAYKGKVVLLEFFATWCPHCQAEAGHLMKFFGALAPERFAFLSVNADSEDPASLYAFDRFFNIPWPTLLDPGSPAGSYKQAGGAGQVTRAYGVALYPTFYIIDARGKIAWRADREQPDLLVAQKLQDAVAK